MSGSIGKMTIRDIDVAGKRVLVRADLNVPMEAGAITDDTRIRESLPTIQYLLEHGAPFVMVANGMPWDNHVFPHEIHQMLVPELDRVLHCLITDMQDRGLLEHTLVIAMGEFGRTPWLNTSRGRDHYPNDRSLMKTVCGLKRGGIVGGNECDGVDADGTSLN